MREYKFKAFWYKDKVTTFVDTIEFLQGGIRVSDGCCHTGWQGKDCELREYTGLHDKNGKEIYEGDIVTANWYDYEEPNHTTTGIVEFCQGWMAYWIADYENKVFDEMNGQGLYYWDIEVIGNKWDNPELLKEGSA